MSGLISRPPSELVGPDEEIIEVKDVAVQTALTTEQERVQRMRNLEDLVGSVYFRVQELKAIYLHNYNRGIKLIEMGPYEAPLDYKLNQLDGDVTKLRDILGFAPSPTQEKPKPFSKTKKLEDRK